MLCVHTTLKFATRAASAAVKPLVAKSTDASVQISPCCTNDYYENIVVIFTRKKEEKEEEEEEAEEERNCLLISSHGCPTWKINDL